MQKLTISEIRLMLQMITSLPSSLLQPTQLTFLMKSFMTSGFVTEIKSPAVESWKLRFAPATNKNLASSQAVSQWVAKKQYLMCEAIQDH